MSSDEDYYDDEYDEDSAHLNQDDSEDDEDYGLGSVVYDEEYTLRPSQPRFSVLGEGEILQRQSEAVEDVATVLSVEASEAAILLRHFKWSVSQVNDEWFHNEERVRQAVGILDLSSNPTPLPNMTTHHAAGTETQSGRGKEDVTCGICFECFQSTDLKPASCEKHFFCQGCWKGYISTGIADGPGCLNMRCPDPECEAAVKENFILLVAPDDLRAKYKRYLLRSYVDDNRNAKWCPAPGCEYAVEFFPDSSNYDVTCKCGHNFCWSCNEEAHRPVDCETVAKWIMKNSAESENMNWILAHSKACPKCRRPIEKNLGCMHMTCTPPCKHEFCWLCLAPWSEHGEKTGGFYACNRYETARHKGMYDEAERRKEMAMNSLEKYTHYYERWAANEQSRMKAIESLKEMQASKIELLSEQQKQPISQLKFITDAWLQVVECRRVLKWTYAYGYYLPWEEQAKRQFFEYLQGEADSALENLHRMAEKELSKYVECGSGEAGEPDVPFSEFKSRLAGLTSVTHTYFENLVRALENGLSDVEQNAAIATKQSQQQHSKGKKEKKAHGSSSVAGPSSTPGTVSGSNTTTITATNPNPNPNSSSASRNASSTMARLAKAAVRGGRSAMQGSSSGAGAPVAAGVSRTQAPGGSAAGGASTSSRSQLPLRDQDISGAVGSATASFSRQQHDEVSYWSCAHCTYANRQAATLCAMCNLPRGTVAR